MKAASSSRPGAKKVNSKQPKEEEPLSMRKESEIMSSKNKKRAVMPTQEDSN